MLEWQFIVVGLLVLFASVYLLRSSWKTWFGKRTGCGGNCGCDKKMAKAGKTSGDSISLIPLEELTLRKRG